MVGVGVDIPSPSWLPVAIYGCLEHAGLLVGVYDMLAVAAVSPNSLPAIFTEIFVTNSLPAFSVDECHVESKFSPYGQPTEHRLDLHRP